MWAPRIGTLWSPTSFDVKRELPAKSDPANKELAAVPADRLASIICPIPVKPTAAASIRAVSQPYHAFPAPDGSRGSPEDTSLFDFVFARTTRGSVGHRRTRHRHGSGP
jgi:hypothetical protein